jgi:hypothetical protein
MSLLSQAVSRKPTVGQEYDHQIFLVDSSDAPTEAQPPSQSEDTDISRASTPAQRPETESLSTVEQQTRTRRSLRRELIKRKYSKFQESRYKAPQVKETQKNQDNTHGPPKDSQGNVAAGHDPLDHYHGRRGRRRERGEHSLQLAIEVLYENQRGGFMCGLPMFSSKSLLNFDPSAWTNAAFKSSPVNITNAQVPDPSWTWAWKSWYVDMSLDVDDEGWQYSYSFQPYFSWHGTHVWFHSFVRRRRWLRQRVRARPIHGGPGKEDQQIREANMLNDDYFTIHNAGVKSQGSSLVTGVMNPQSSEIVNENEQDHEDTREIKDIDSLVKALRGARIDREKVEAIMSFVDHGGDELIYLVDRMPDIMDFFIFQESRRQLLELLMHRFDSATEELTAHEDAGKDDLDPARRRTAHLEAAVKAADDQVKHLQYWSDAQHMTHEGLVKNATDTAHGWGDDWKGLDQSGPS